MSRKLDKRVNRFKQLSAELGEDDANKALVKAIAKLKRIKVKKEKS